MQVTSQTAHVTLKSGPSLPGFSTPSRENFALAEHKLSSKRSPSPLPTSIAACHLSRCSRGSSHPFEVQLAASRRQLRPLQLTQSFRSGISSFARASRPAFQAASRRSFRPTTSRFPLGSRLASTQSVGDGKIYQVSPSLSMPLRSFRVAAGFQS